MKRRVIPMFFCALFCFSSRLLAADTDALIQWLLEDGRELKNVPFPEIIQATTGRQVLPIRATNAIDRTLLAKIGKALDKVLKEMNSPQSSAQTERRINEVSSHFEAALKKALNEVPGFACDFPKTTSGHVQRSGYPDLRMMDKTSGRVFYLDPKLYEKGSRDSSFRTFYFEPKKETNKIHDDAHHLIVGIEHDGGQRGVWKFLRWELVDLAHFRVRLKAEFQGSNHDLYREEAIVGRSGDTKPDH